MSEEINKMMGILKQGQGVQANYEFKKVLSEHANMLDSRKTQKYYTEEQMRKLVDDEFNVLNMLIDVFLKDLTEDIEGIVLSIYSLAAMFSESLRYYDELYYFNNKEAIGAGDVWHSSHDNWMATFDRLLSVAVVEKLQDHGLFDLKLSTVETDLYYINLVDQVKEFAENVTDNQMIIKTLDSEEKVARYSEFIRDDVAEGIREAFDQTEGVRDNPEMTSICEEAMRQVALAI